MNFDCWKKISKRRQKEITKTWNLRKSEGREIAAAVLKAFNEQYGSNKNIEIYDEIIRLRDNAGWGINVQCFNGMGFKKTPANYMGVAVSRFHIDHVDDGTFFQLIPPKLWQRRTLRTPISS